MFWLGVAIGAAGGALIATLIAYDRGLNRANRQWVEKSEQEHQARWPKRGPAANDL